MSDEKMIDAANNEFRHQLGVLEEMGELDIDFAVRAILDAGGYPARVAELEAENKRLRTLLVPFAHRDLSALLGGNIQDDASIVYQRNNAILRLGDFRAVRAALVEGEE